MLFYTKSQSCSSEANQSLWIVSKVHTGKKAGQDPPSVLTFLVLVETYVVEADGSGSLPLLPLSLLSANTSKEILTTSLKAKSSPTFI